ncbi:MAG: aldo/keto reductase, partial [Intestinibacter sp.]
MNKVGFGFLRLPKINQNDDKSIDFALLNEMVDSFLQKGGKYFDTAYTYLDGESEKALKKCLVKRHPRKSFLIADKLPTWKIKSHEECYEYFEEQLIRCGVTYFDNYMLHWLNKDHYNICQKYDEFEFLKELKKQGKARKIGFSYHDNAELLDIILTDHPEVDYIQLQINYLDWKSPSVEAEKCYNVAKKHDKQIIVMEPVKGGTLANLPKEADEIFKKIHPEKSTASW